MPTDEWERGYAAGWRAAIRDAARDITTDMESRPVPGTGLRPPHKPKRKASAYSKRYGAAFRKLSPKYKLKNGSWGKDGFKRCQKAAHKLARRD